MKRFLPTSLLLAAFILASGLFLPQSMLTSASAQDAAVAQLPRTLVPANKMHEAWWKARHEANCARIAQGNVDFLLIGDSITHGWDGAGKEIQAFFYGDRNYVNMGFGGDQTQHVLWRLNDAPMDKIQPKAAMLLIGINSLWGDWENCSENVALGIQACVDKLQALYPDIKILVLDIFVVLEPESACRPRAAAASAKMRELLRDYKNVQFMDINDLWLNEKSEIPRELMGDLVHPSREGYILWGNRVEPVIAEMLGDKAKEWK
ncbi:MAG: GDSL-type esterase/lipase family protein [Planctomycetia bacterium]|nr:GDSL-type esterase/lipase family protein [Planctomycetia bacterium]